MTKLNSDFLFLFLAGSRCPKGSVRGRREFAYLLETSPRLTLFRTWPTTARRMGSTTCEAAKNYRAALYCLFSRPFEMGQSTCVRLLLSSHVYPVHAYVFGNSVMVGSVLFLFSQSKNHIRLFAFVTLSILAEGKSWLSDIAVVRFLTYRLAPLKLNSIFTY